MWQTKRVMSWWPVFEYELNPDCYPQFTVDSYFNRRFTQTLKPRGGARSRLQTPPRAASPYRSIHRTSDIPINVLGWEGFCPVGMLGCKKRIRKPHTEWRIEWGNILKTIRSYFVFWWTGYGGGKKFWKKIFFAGTGIMWGLVYLGQWISGVYFDFTFFEKFLQPACVRLTCMHRSSSACARAASRSASANRPAARARNRGLSHRGER